MASATLTLIGMYNWDNTLFNGLVLPDGIDKDLFINSLLLKAGEFEVLYPDPDFMKQSIAVWGSKWYRTFAEWLRGTQATWNPIHNYDRYEDIEDQHKKQYGYTDSPKYDEDRTLDTADTRTPTLTEKRTLDTADTRTPTLTEKRTLDTADTRTPTLTEKTTHNTTVTHDQITDSTTMHDVSAYDQSGYTASSKDTIHNGQTRDATTGDETIDTYGSDATTHTGTDTLDTYGSDATTHTGSDTLDTYGTDKTAHTGTDKLHIEGKRADVSGSESNGNWHTGHIYGNIGITQSADMLRNFYDIAKWNLYDHMSDTFTNELLIPVY